MRRCSSYRSSRRVLLSGSHCDIPIFCVGWHFSKTLHTRLQQSEEDLEKVTVRSEISTWWLVLAVTFGILYEAKFFGIVNLEF